jgi:hypothetical protein
MSDASTIGHKEPAKGAGPDSQLPHSAEDFRKQHAQVETAKSNFLSAAIILGQMLIEKRDEMTKSFAATANDFSDGRTKPTEMHFTLWLSRNCKYISQRTAYTWMDAAGSVMRHLLESHGNDSQVFIELDGEKSYISFVLRAPEAQCTQAMLTFRETLAKFLENRTLTEVTHETLSAAVQRASNGASADQLNGDDRINWPFFIGKNLQGVAAHLTHWEGMGEDQKTLVKTIIGNLILGEATTVRVKGQLRTIKPGEQGLPWPDDLLNYLRAKLKKRGKDGTK